jgi:uncharacterized protein (TIGR03437 family)
MISRLFSAVFLLILSSLAGVCAPGLNRLDIPASATVNCMTSDSSGNLYLGITFTETGGDPWSAPHWPVVLKLDSSLKEVYRYAFPTTSQAKTTSIAVDSTGEVILAGSAKSNTFPLVNPLSSDLLPDGGTAFISKLSADGSRLVFSTLWGGAASGAPSTWSSEGSSVSAIAVDGNGNILFTGFTTSPDIPITDDALRKDGPVFRYFAYSTFAFFSKIDAAGGKIIYSTFLGDNAISCSSGSLCFSTIPYTTGKDLAVAPNGDAIVVGSTDSVNFPVTSGAYETKCYCWADIVRGWVMRFRADNTLAWSTYLGGESNAYSRLSSIDGVRVTPDGSAVVAGVAQSPNLGTQGAFLSSAATSSTGAVESNVFVARLDASGSSLGFATYLGALARPDNFGIGGPGLDSDGRIWVTGATGTPDLLRLDSTPPFGTTFAVALSSDGTKLEQSWLLPNGEAAQALVVDSSGVVTLAVPNGFLLQLPRPDATAPAVFGVANTAGTEVSPGLAPGELVSLYGVHLGPSAGVGAELDATGSIPTALGGTKVLFNGIAAPLFYSSDNQVNAVVPFEVSGGSLASVAVQTVAGNMTALKLDVENAAPEIFSVVVPEQGGWRIAGVNQDGSINTLDNAAVPGSFVSMWVSGAGLFDRSLATGSIAGIDLSDIALPVKVDIDGLDAEVLYAGTAPYMVAGVMQVNVRIPVNVPRKDYHTVRIRVGDTWSDAVLLGITLPLGH